MAFRETRRHFPARCLTSDSFFVADLFQDPAVQSLRIGGERPRLRAHFGIVHRADDFHIFLIQAADTFDDFQVFRVRYAGRIDPGPVAPGEPPKLGAGSGYPFGEQT